MELPTKICIHILFIYFYIILYYIYRVLKKKCLLFQLFTVCRYENRNPDSTFSDFTTKNYGPWGRLKTRPGFTLFSLVGLCFSSQTVSASSSVSSSRINLSGR